MTDGREFFDSNIVSSCHPVQGNWSLFIPRAERMRELSGHLLRSPQSLRGFHRGFQKGFHFQNESCDCIKYLNLGDPCCGSGGMFVQSAKFVENHSGNINNIAIYGEDSNPTTWKMAQMNLAMLTASLFFM